ncbi:MAG: hypothetical protein JWO73_551 [Candidatus Taylorbacteria bacterium]|nr:hypothetical protein [Candidatus Taylorbacteria bacterium]
MEPTPHINTDEEDREPGSFFLVLVMAIPIWISVIAGISWYHGKERLICEIIIGICLIADLVLLIQEEDLGPISGIYFFACYVMTVFWLHSKTPGIIPIGMVAFWIVGSAFLKFITELVTTNLPQRGTD